MKIERITRIEPLDITVGLELEEELYNKLLSHELDLGYFIWRSKKALVVPKRSTRLENFKKASDELSIDGWPVVIRSTGGELTPQCESFFNLSIFMRCPDKSIGIKESYGVICRAIIGWLSEMGVSADHSSIDGAFCDGNFNVNINGMKIAGTAQKWTRKKNSTKEDEVALLLHAVFLCDGDLESLWDTCNKFYSLCDVDLFIENNKHISLSRVLSSSCEDFVENAINNLSNYMDSYIHSECIKYIN